MTKIINCKNNYTKDMIIKPANSIKDGKLVVFPTETVYGIGASMLNEEAIKNIFICKGRKQDNPLIVHVSNKNMIKEIAHINSLLEEKIIDTFFPGPLTIILNKKNIVPNIVTGELDTVGIRMPNNQIALDLIELSSTPIVAPSANISGKPSGTNINDIKDELNNKVDYIIDAGNTSIGVESTVIRVIDNIIHILRPGKITKEDLLKIHNKVIIDKHVLNKLDKDTKVLSPGVKYKHYAPESKCLLILSETDELFINKVNELSQNKRVLVLCKTHNIKHFNTSLDLGETLEDISKNIFTLLRKVDSYKADLVIIEGVKPVGLGLAIMNRLLRACSHNYLYIS